MKKYNNKANVLGMLLKEHREKLGLSKEEVCRQVQLHGVYIHRVELYRMELGQSIIKDFELYGFAHIFKIPMESLLEDFISEINKEDIV